MSGEESGPEQPLPPHVTTPLLTLITQRSLDEDYAAAAVRRERAGHEAPRQTRLRVVSAVAVGVFALLATVVAVQTQRDAEVDELSRSALVDQVEERSERTRALQSQARALSVENQELMATDTRLDAELDERESQAERAAMVGAFLPVRGEGVRITVSNPPGATATTEIRDEDLATLVDALWHAGAEAIAINSERLSSVAGIRNTGRSIHVGGRPVNPPYVIEAVGERDTLQANLLNSAQGQRWFILVNELGFGYEPQNVSGLRLPAARLIAPGHAVVPGPADANPVKGGGAGS